MFVLTGVQQLQLLLDNVTPALLYIRGAAAVRRPVLAKQPHHVLAH
jgi:hypothetical protein